MANDKKFVVKNGLQSQNISFVDSGKTNTITANMLSSDTLSFEGELGQLFSIADSMSGTIFSVNDVSGIPSIEVNDDGEIRFAETFGHVLIGTDSSTDTSKHIVQVKGGFNADSATIDGTVTATSFSGSGASLTSLNASNLGSGTVPSARLSLTASDIPNLATSKITSGVFDSARLPSLAAADIAGGTFDSARIPSLAAADTVTGVFDSARIPAIEIDASKIASGTIANARLDAQLQDVAGLAVTDGGIIVGNGSNFVLETGSTARTSLGLGTAAVAATGISNGNVAVFTSGAADNDFLRIDGTAIEGRSAAEVLSDISASPAAGSSSIVTTGALDAGSITSGFGSIDNGSSAITTTGVITGGTIEATADTSAGDNAAIGYTASEGLILTGQGSSADVTIKNDADATVASIATGTTVFTIDDDITVVGRAVGSTITAENDATYDLAVGNNFTTTTAGTVTVTFTNKAAGQSGCIKFVNGGNHTVNAHADVAISATGLAALAVTGTYLVTYYVTAASGDNTILLSVTAALT